MKPKIILYICCNESCRDSKIREYAKLLEFHGLQPKVTLSQREVRTDLAVTLFRTESLVNDFAPIYGLEINHILDCGEVRLSERTRALLSSRLR